MKKTFEIEINKADFEILDQYGFMFERNIEEFLKDLANQTREGLKSYGFLSKRYFSFVNELDPFRDTDEDPETLEEMLYNLLAIKEDWTEMEPDLSKVLDTTIQQFKAAGIEAIND